MADHIYNQLLIQQYKCKLQWKYVIFHKLSFIVQDITITEAERTSNCTAESFLVRHVYTKLVYKGSMICLSVWIHEFVLLGVGSIVRRVLAIVGGLYPRSADTEMLFVISFAISYCSVANSPAIGTFTFAFAH